MGGVMRLVQRRLGALGWEHLVPGEARIGYGVGAGIGIGIGLRQGRLFGSSASSALSVSPCWSRSLSTSSPPSLSLLTGSSTSTSSWSSRNRSGIRRYVILCSMFTSLCHLNPITIIITTGRLLCPLPASDWTHSLQLSSIPSNGLACCTMIDARQSHSLTATPPLFVPRFPDLIPFNPLSRAIFWRLVALLSHH